MPTIFLSYARVDRPRVAPIASALEQAGWSVWWDPEILPGTRFDDVIERELDNADAVVCVWTASSVESDWVKIEATEGKARKVLVPVAIERDLVLPLAFRSLQYVDLTDWSPGSRHPGFDQVISGIKAVLDAALSDAATAPAPEPSVEPPSDGGPGPIPPETSDPPTEPAVEHSPLPTRGAAPRSAEPAPDVGATPTSAKSASAPPERDIGVTLSGGGNRATVFGLGALLAIADAGLAERTVSVSSVSGGSIANGIVMAGPDYGVAPAAEVEAHVATAVRSIAERGILQGGAPATAWYLRSFVASVYLTVVSVVVAIIGVFANLPVVSVVAIVVLVGTGPLTLWLFSRRSKVTDRAIDNELLGGASTTLADQGARDLAVHHVICATEIQAGTSFFFSNRMVYGWQFGGTVRAPNVPLSTAVQASACVPGAFRARTLKLHRLNLSPGALRADDHPAFSDVVDQIVVVDGAVSDCLADGWEYGFAGRARRWTGLSDAQPTGAGQLIVVNGSSDWNAVHPLPGGGLRFELDAVLRSNDVQFNSSKTHRRQTLASGFIAGGADLLDGVLVQITDDPYRLAEALRSKPGWEPDDRARWADEARAFLDRYGVSKQEWGDIARASAAVPTTLKPLGTHVCASLLEHAYILTTANLHVVFGHGDMTRTVDRASFTRLAGGH